jgi:O-antigen ligase
LFIIAFISLMVKDPLGDTYILRGLSQFLCVLAAIAIINSHSREISFSKYLFLFLFLLSTAISALFSQSMIYSALQTISLTSVILFFVAYNEVVDERKIKSDVMKFLLRLFILLISFSLILGIIVPSFAYYYDEFERISRLCGIFHNPEYLATISGLTLGLWFFSKDSEISILLKVVVTAIILTALFLTGCRTYWVASIIAMVVVFFWINSFSDIHWNIRSISIGFLCCFGALLLMIIGEVDISTIINRVSRSESVVTLSGRTILWEYALDKFIQRPIFGYGLGAGDDALKGQSSELGDTEDQLTGKTRSTMHNGFIQVLMDGGVVGFMLYSLALIKALYNLMLTQKREYAASFYAITFFTVANMGQSMIFGAATFVSFLTWYYVVLGLSINNKNKYTII